MLLKSVKLTPVTSTFSHAHIKFRDLVIFTLVRNSRRSVPRPRTENFREAKRILHAHLPNTTFTWLLSRFSESTIFLYSSCNDEIKFAVSRRMFSQTKQNYVNIHFDVLNHIYSSKKRHV